MTLEHAMERIGRIVAADQDLVVEVRGRRAYATPGRVVIPSIDTFEYLGDDAERVLHAILDHECGHANESDFAGMDREFRNLAEPYRRLLHWLFMTIEDAYIEARQGARYPGSRHNFRKLYEWFWTRIDPKSGSTTPGQIADPDVDFWIKLGLSLNAVLRRDAPRKMSEIAALNAEVYATLLRCQAEIDEAIALHDTPGATVANIRLAARIYAKVDEHHKTEEAPSEDLLVSATRAAMDAIEQREREHTNGEDPYIVFSHEYDHEVDFTGDVTGSKRFAQLEEDSAAAHDSLTLAFESALRTSRSHAYAPGFDEGDSIRVEDLVSYAVGAQNADTIYEQRIPTDLDDREVAVAVLIDCSGSMRGAPAYLAASTATAIHKALASCQIEHEITGFTTATWPMFQQLYHVTREWEADPRVLERAVQHLREAHKAGDDPRRYARIFRSHKIDDLYNRTPPIVVPMHAIFKRFGSNDARGLARIEGVMENLDAEALLWQARRLAMRHEPRRVMFVLSDGQPSGTRDNVDHDGHLRRTVRRVIDAGIEVYAIGMCSSHVQSYYPTHWVAHSMADLARIAVDALGSVLTEQRMERAWVHI